MAGAMEDDGESVAVAAASGEALWEVDEDEDEDEETASAAAAGAARARMDERRGAMDVTKPERINVVEGSLAETPKVRRRRRRRA